MSILRCGGNQVWNDVDNDGMLEPGEEPIEGVVVHLFSDEDGDYLFTDLAHGDYIVGIAPENFAAGGRCLPTSRAATPRLIGSMPSCSLGCRCCIPRACVRLSTSDLVTRYSNRYPVENHAAGFDEVANPPVESLRSAEFSSSPSGRWEPTVPTAST